jgi:hypothetical protein
VVGNRFSVELRGTVICCYDGIDGEEPYTVPHGWPLIDSSALREIAYAGGNYTHVRALGSDPGRLPAILAEAQTLGIYVEVDVLDGWQFRRRVTPWATQGCEVMAAAPRSMHRAWVLELVKAAGGYPNVLWQIGNENNLCDVSREWELGVRDAIRDAETLNGYQRHLIGSNSGRADVEREVDYVTVHGEDAALSGPTPRLVNETKDSRTSPEAYERALRDACAQGTYFALWRGLMKNAEWERALEIMRAYKCVR